MRKRKEAPSRRELFAVIRRLETRVAEQDRRIDAQERRIREFEIELATARKNSSTSSKPPSSDIVKPPKRHLSASYGKRKIGGRPGHALHERHSFPPEAVNESQVHTLDACPDCGHRLLARPSRPRV